MRRHWIIPAVILLNPLQSVAQTLPGTGINLPGSSGKTCVQVAVPGEKPSPYDCLNQELQQQAQGAGASQPALPLGATSPSNQVGTFNEQSVSEQYGKNFGKSVIPFRPPPPVYGNVLGPAR